VSADPLDWRNSSHSVGTYCVQAALVRSNPVNED
jgi:hypothetical protein